MAAELFEHMYKQMLHIASNEDFPDEEYVSDLFAGIDPTRKDIKWDKLSETKLGEKKAECKENVENLLDMLDKQFKVGKHTDASTWDDDLMAKINEVYLNIFWEQGDLLFGFGTETDDYIEKLEEYAVLVQEIIKKHDFPVAQQELKGRRLRMQRRAYYALTIIPSKMPLPLATPGSYWAIYKAFERCPGALREVCFISLFHCYFLL